MSDDIESRYKNALKAALNSQEETKVGAVIYDSGELVSFGWNHVLRDSEGEDKIIHAEDHALTELLHSGKMPLNNAVMYIAGKHPCLDCAKLISTMNISEVHCPPKDKNSKWVKSNYMASYYLKLFGVKLVYSNDLKGIEVGLTCESKYTED